MTQLSLANFMTMYAGAALNSSAPDTATEVISWTGGWLSGSSFDIPISTKVTFSPAWYFTLNQPVDVFFVVDGMTFNLTSSTVVFQQYSVIDMNITGYMNNEYYIGALDFDGIPSNMAFGLVISSNHNSIPDTSSTLLLLGLALGLITYKKYKYE